MPTAAARLTRPLLAVLLSALELPSWAAAAQPDMPPPAAASPAWRNARFDLAALPVAADRAATAGADVAIAPGVVAGLGAADRQDGAAAPTGTVAPLFQRRAELSGRLGLLVGARGLVFGRLGYSEFDLNEAFAGTGARGFSSGGVLVGAGTEARLSSTLSVRTEAHTVDYRADLSDRQLLGGLAWRY